MVLTAVPAEGSTTTALAEQVGRPAEAVRAAVLWLVDAGWVEATGDSVALTPTGRMAAAQVRGSWTPSAAGLASTVDLGEVTRFFGSLWPADPERAAAEEAERDRLLASDADRDSAVNQLSEAFSQGRLSQAELEQRTSTALSARTYGELDEVLQGLGGLRREVRSQPVKKAVFWVVGAISSPFVLLGALFLAFGTDLGDRFFGLVVLVLLLPGLLALRRWAWPRA